MKLKNKFVIAAFAFTMIWSAESSAQEALTSPRKDDVTIGNTNIKREGTDIVVDYQILLGDNVLSCNVNVVLNVGTDGIRKVLKTKDLVGDFGKIKTSGYKQIRYNVEKDKQLLAGKDLSLTLEVKGKNVLNKDVIAIASLGVYPQMSYGLMLGYVKRFGGYVKFRSDFRFAGTSYTCNSSGEVTGGGYVWTTGNQRKNRLQATAGFLARADRWLYPYVGLGYGYREVHWEDYDGAWAKVSDFSCAGFAAEAGLIFRIGPVAISAGVSTTALKFSEMEVGVGLMF